MDDLLKAYAKKRRDEAGDPIEMHPATRRLLQAEAAKLRPKAPEQSKSWFSPLLMFWPRYAFAAALFVALGLVTWSFFEFGEHPQQMALLDSEQNVPRPEPAGRLESAEKLAATGTPPPLSEFKKESEVRQMTGRELDSVALREEASVRLKSVADESKAKRNVAEFAVNEARQKSPEASRAPSASAPVIAPTSPTEKPAVRRLAAVDAQDKRKLNEPGDTALAGGKSVAFNDAQTLNQPPTTSESPPTSLNRDLKLSESATKPQLDALSTANAVTLQLADAPGSYNERIGPLGNSRALELFGLTNPPAGARFGQNKALAANSAQAPFDNYSRLPGLQANSAGANAQNSQFFRAPEAEALARQDSRVPAPQSPPPSPAVSEAGIAATGPVSQQTPVSTGAGRFYSQTGTAGQTGQSGTQSRSRFSQVQSTGGPSVTRRAGVAGTPVLTEFDFEQTGNRVRVVDADGSVYDGQILEAAKVDFDDGTKDRARRDAVTTTTLRRVPSQSSPAEGADAGTPAWNFRASGTNRTLQQPVTINAVLYGVSTNRAGQIAAPAKGLQSQTQQATPQSANTAQLPVQRIQGRVQVGAGVETQLDAVRRGN
jgi:hypothetical protein